MSAPVLLNLLGKLRKRDKIFIHCQTRGHVISIIISWADPYGPGREKTCLRGFRQSEIQTSLLSYRD